MDFLKDQSFVVFNIGKTASKKLNEEEHGQSQEE